MSRPATHPRRSSRSTRPGWRRTTATAAVVLALGSLAACQDDDKSGAAGTDGESTPSSAGSSASSEGSDPTESAGNDESDAAGSDVAAGDEISPSDFVDLYAAAFEKASTTTISMEFGGALKLGASGVADFSTTPPEMQISMSDPSTGQDIAMVLSEGAMYVQVAPEQYLRYDLSDPTGPLAGVTDQLDPSALVDTFAKGVTAASYVGEEDVDGETMDHYTVTIDTAAMLGDTEVPDGTVPAESTFELWFDGDGLFRRMKGDLGPTAGTFKASYDNWGEPVDITTPPESQVTELPAPSQPQG